MADYKHQYRGSLHCAAQVFRNEGKPEPPDAGAAQAGRKLTSRHPPIPPPAQVPLRFVSPTCSACQPISRVCADPTRSLPDRGFTMSFLRLWPHSVLSLLIFEQLRRLTGIKPI